MKNIRLVGMALLALFMSVSFSACGGSDDDEPQPSSNPLIGTWEMTDIDGDDYILEFKADGTFYQAEFYGKTEKVKISYKGTYKILSVSGNTYEVSFISKEKQKMSGEIVTDNETVTRFVTLSDNNNTLAISGSSDIWKRKK
ncbi:TIGR03066 family protein [Prevotella sp. ne3005]|uniref:hypothetical protein n=1 Tax=Prevotella sp. ne3005 TaxID=1761887 RepID=UPI0008B245C9|nr:hypothetical protein [Prevotella sp. ne3005]SEN33137.1 TIGR03066 family protein [Prevotella sp. ne3005]